MHFAQDGSALLKRWTRFTIKYARTVVSISVFLSLLIAFYTANNLGINTNTEDMISNKLEWRQNVIEFRNQFPEKNRSIVVLIKGKTSALADQATAYLDDLLDHSDQIKSSYAATNDAPIAGQELLYLETEALEDLSDDLTAAQPLLGRLRENYSLPVFLDMLALLIEKQPEDNAAFIEKTNSIIAESLESKDVSLDWGLSRDNQNSLVRIIVVAPVLDTAIPRQARWALEAIDQFGQETENAFSGQVEINVTGIIALEDEELVSVSQNAKLSGFLALALVAVVLLMAFRSLRFIAISILALFIGLICTAGFAAWAVGSLNVISVAFTMLYIGLAVDFVIHYLLRVRELTADGNTLPTALETTSGDVGGSLFICSVTTAVAFYAFMPTSFTGISELGLISGTGMFISLLVTLTLVPSLAVLILPNELALSPTAKSWAFGERVSNLLDNKKLVLGMPILLAIASAATLQQLVFEADPILIRDPNTESVQTFYELSESPQTAPNFVSIIVPPDNDPVALATELEQLPQVHTVRFLSNFIPQNIEYKQFILDDLAILLGPRFHQFSALETVNQDELRRSLAAFSSLANADNPLLTELKSNLSKLEDALSVDASDTENNETNRIVSQLQENLLADLPRAMEVLALRLYPQGLSIDSLPSDFTRQWQTDSGATLLEVVPSEDVTEPDSAKKFVSAVQTLAPNVTGLPVVYQEAGGTVRDAFIQAFIYALIAVSLLLLLFLRSLKDTALVLIPLTMGALIIVGIANLIGLPFNFANVIALPLMLGIGVDNGIHMVHRARLLKQGEKLLGSSTARAILFSGLTTLVSFGSLATSSHLGMAGMGLLLSIGLIVIIGIMIFVLPTLLAMSSDKSASI